MATSTITKDVITIEATTPSTSSTTKVYTGSNLYNKYAISNVAIYFNNVWMTRLDGADGISDSYINANNEIYLTCLNANLQNKPCRIMLQRI